MFATRFLLIAMLAGLCFLPAPGQVDKQTLGERMADEYFRQQTARIGARALADVHTLADWQSRRATYRQQLLEMLGLSPLPPRGDLKATLTGKVETEKFTVEKIHFQSMPGLYVTANLYLPKNLKGPAPTVLYLCGHLQTVKDGIAYGTKVGYRHHPAWLAEHGYVALILDTLEMGEIEGEHHGTHRRGMWWWPTRGYTPAGVETWNAMRALDYLATRPEVDTQRIGLTGRSGGGAYTWFLAAVDDRPSVLIPVAGVTDMTNHVVDGCIEGHCDCMFQVNTYGWDFSMLVALAAPRPLLFSNSDKDTIFPLDGVQRVHRDLKRIYKLYNAEDKLGLLITEGPHGDTQDLQVPAFRWLNRWLKKETGLLSEPALKRFEVEQLKVFTTLPADQINTRVHDTFVPAAPPAALPSMRQEWQTLAARWSTVLREKVFNNWPAADPRPAVKVVSDAEHTGVRARLIEFHPDDAYRLQLALLTPMRQTPTRLAVHVLDEEQWRQWSAAAGEYFPALFASENNNGAATELLKPLQQGTAIALVLPRGIGPTAWRKEKETHIRRRFLLLGQSLETMQVWDTRAALSALRSLPLLGKLPVSLQGARTMSVVALFAALFEEGVTRLDLERLPSTLAHGPSFPNVLRFFDLPQLVALAFPRAVNLSGVDPGDWEWSLKAAKLSEGAISFSQGKTVPVPGVVIDYSPASSQQYIGSPSIAVLPNGEYVASHDFFGPGSTYSKMSVFSSRDKGLSWEKRADIEGQWWSTLFVHKGALYLMGTTKEYGFTVIRRSTDGGRTWTEPKDENSGLLLGDGAYHCSPQPVVIHQGRIWRAMEDAMNGAKWGERFNAFMMSAPLEADLLKASSWTSSNRLSRNPAWLDGKFNAWLEGNAVVTPAGKIVNILRVDIKQDDNEKAAIVRISDDGKQANFDQQQDFIDFPGGSKKFTIRWDEKSKSYWALANYIPEQHRRKEPSRTRNTLALIRSTDLRNWEVRTILLYHPDTAKHGFQYADWLLDPANAGNDLIAVVRTASDDAADGAHNQHDANYLTFHRFRNFRQLTMKDSVAEFISVNNK